MKQIVIWNCYAWSILLVLLNFENTHDKFMPGFRTDTTNTLNIQRFQTSV